MVAGLVQEIPYINDTKVRVRRCVLKPGCEFKLALTGMRGWYGEGFPFD